MSIRLGDGTMIAGGATTMPLLTSIWSDHLINEVSWLRADTFSWQSGSVYTSVYNHLVADISGVTAETETINDIEITFYRANDGHKIVLANQHDNIYNLYASTGVAWYYILDTENTRFKLPRTKFGFEGLRTSVGSYIEAGLPDHSHYLNLNTRTVQTGTNFVNAKQPVTGGDVSGYASETNPIYGSSDTVQERATQMYLYFFVGNYIQGQTSIDVGTIAEELNGKLDISSPQATAPYITETYKDGTNWYRVWSDGWVEQGGRGTSSGVGFTTITLLKEMADTNYTLLNCNNRASQVGDQRDAYIISTTQIGVGSDGAIPIWYVCGEMVQ